MSFRKKLNKNPIINFLSSTKLAVILIFLLIVLVITGTLEQSANGLYAAREKYFDTYLSFIGPVPFPGVLSILWLMTLNLSLSFAFRFNFTKRNLGLILSHSGLILLFVSGFFHFYYSQESFIEIHEAELRSRSESYDDWRLKLSLFDESFKPRSSQDLSLKDLRLGEEISISDSTKLKLAEKYTNARVFETPFAGIQIKEFPEEKEFEANNPALKLIVNDNEKEFIALDASFNNYKKDFIYDAGLYLVTEIKRKEFQLPFSVRLLDVTRELHPNTEVAKSYASKIVLKSEGITREATVSMNKPIRSGLYTVYQARYGIDLDGNEFSVLAVVKNLNYQLPYYATFLINFGLLLHFILAFIAYRKKGANT